MAVDFSGYQETFREHLAHCRREEALRFSGMLLKEGLVTVPELYERVLTPALNSVFVCRENEDDTIWREHVMSGIVRSAVEASFPYVLRARDELSLSAPLGKAMLACPEEEYHELGARMGADFYVMAGYETIFIGANTPRANILSAARALKPAIVSLSVSNYLNLVPLGRIVAELRAGLPGGTKIFVSGGAFRLTNKKAEDFGADALVNSYADILNARGDVHEDRA
jgi:methanogenic corrinoid protein MtbC1